jgi:hypothetical protein
VVWLTRLLWGILIHSARLPSLTNGGAMRHRLILDTLITELERSVGLRFGLRIRPFCHWFVSWPGNFALRPPARLSSNKASRFG